MTVAFYAPLKPITSPRPSGDRLIGRLFKRALETAGYETEIVSTFRSYDKNGDAARQERIKEIGQKLAQRLIKKLRNHPPDFWFTYHLYRKAPDWIGPTVSQELGIPYVVAEASFAPSQANGAWADGHKAVQQTLTHVSLAIGSTAHDEACLLPELGPASHYCRIKPFLNTAPFNDVDKLRQKARATLVTSKNIPDNVPILLCVAMMRPGVKFQSYQVLADALLLCRDHPWHLLVVGDGPESQAVKQMFNDTHDRISWLGAKNAEDIVPLYAASDVFVWPSVRESPGMVFLEAQASGLPVIGGNGGSVADVITHGEGGFLAEKGDAVDYANNLKMLLDDPSLRQKMGQAARLYVRENHTIEIAARDIKAGLSQVLS